MGTTILKPWMHLLCVVAGIAAPIAVTIWSTSDSGARSKQNYARVEAQAAQAGLAKPFVFEPSLPEQTDADRMKSAIPGSPEAVVNAFNQMAFIDHDAVGAMRKYLSPDFVERDPDFAVPGAASDKDAAIDMFSKRGWKPGESANDKIYLVMSDGDYVLVFHHVTPKPGSPGSAFADIFKVRDGLIVEHWAVGQPMPTRNLSKKHSMF